MHVIIVDTTLTTPPTGGAHTFLVDLTEELIRKGWQVSVVSQPGSDSGIADALRDRGAELVMHLWQAHHLPEEKATRLSRLVNERKPDVYVVSASPDVGWLTLPLLDGSIATFSIAHNDVGAFYEPLKHYHSFIDCAIGVSEAIHKKIVRDCGVNPDRARYIPYGVRPLSQDEISARTKDDARPLMIGYVGRLVQEQKRVMEFVPLVRELASRGTSFQLKIIGDGPDRNELERRFTAAGLSAYVEFTGWLTVSRVKDLLRTFDIFLLLSDYEGLPVALLEAMAHGVLPVVTQIESGNTQLVRNGQNGYVLPVGDVVGFAKQIDQLARDRQTLLDIGRAAWETSKEYSIEQMTHNYIAAFTETAQAARARRERDGLTADYPVMSSCRSKYPFWLRKIKQRVITLAS